MAKKSDAKIPGGASVPASRSLQTATIRGTAREDARPTTRLKSSALLDTRVIYCGDNLEQLAKLPDACVDLIYIDPPFNSNRNYEMASPARTFWGETKEKRAFADRHESTRAYIDNMRPRCVQLARVLKKSGIF
jgi:16S rRNA G966 N2-methylase RsmD